MEDTARSSLLYNDDIAPISKERQTWGFWPLFGAWASIAAPGSLLVGSAGIAFGFNWWQVLLIALAGDVLTIVPLVIQAHGAVKYGLAEPQLDRTRFGIWGTFIPSFARMIVGFGFWGVQTFLVTEGLLGVVLVLSGSTDSLSALGSPQKMVQAYPVQFWTLFLLATVLQFVIIDRAKPTLGAPSLKLLSKYMPIVAIDVLTFVFVYFIAENGSYAGEAFRAAPAPMSSAMLPILLIYLSSNVHATQVISWPDVMRFGRSYRTMLWSQLGLPVIYSLTIFYGAIMTGIAKAKTGSATYDPILLVANYLHPAPVAAIVLVAFVLLLINTNIFSNAVPPIYDLNNFFPKHLTWRRGAIIVTLVSVLVGAWALYAQGAYAYFSTWLQFVASLLGPFTGVIVADYVFVRRGRINLAAVFSRDGEYYFQKGFNVRALVATGIGYLLLMAGHWGMEFPGWSTLSHFGWLTGLVVSGVLYLIFVRVGSRSSITREPTARGHVPETSRARVDEPTPDAQPAPEPSS